MIYLREDDSLLSMLQAIIIERNQSSNGQCITNVGVRNRSSLEDAQEMEKAIITGCGTAARSLLGVPHVSYGLE